MARRPYSSNSQGAKVKDYDVDGVVFEIHVSPTNGEFRAWDGADWITAKSLPSLQAKLREHVKTNRKIQVPVHFLDDFGPNDDRIVIKAITLTGIRARTRKALYTIDGEEDRGIQEAGYYGTITRRLTGPEIGEFVALVRAQKQAVQAVEDWVDRVRINANETIEAEQEKTSTPPPEPAAGDGDEAGDVDE